MTRKILWLLLLAAVCAFTSLHADLTIVQHFDFMGHGWDTTVMIKAGRMRVDESEAPEMSFITDLQSGETIRLMGPDKTHPGPGQVYHEAIAAAEQQLPGMPKDGWTASTPAGKKATISGYAADEYACSIPGIKASAWLTKAAPDYANLLKEVSAYHAHRPKNPTWEGIFALDMAALPGFPVRAVYEFRPGLIVTSTVLSISTKPIADSELNIPAGYEHPVDG
jgi:hypothetical protein